MKFKFVNEIEKYNGSQLRSLFGYLRHGVLGNSVIAWIGPCEIPSDHIVDGEDLAAGEEIRGGSMVHFIVEAFEWQLKGAVALQRLLTAMAIEELKKFNGDLEIQRRGDDIFIGEGKLSISIATVSPVSALIHFALNITNEDTPVKTACLVDCDVPTEAFAKALGQRFAEEFGQIEEAAKKVKWVGSLA